MTSWSAPSWWTESLGAGSLGQHSCPSEDRSGLVDDPGAFSGPPWAAPNAFSASVLPALTLVRCLCHPLAYLHGEGIVHLDLKPENVLVTERGQPVIVDFGLTQQFGGKLSREALQISGHPAGTAPYMAPEQVRGGLCDARADLYALGCILYEILTGSPPFVAETPAQLLHMHLHSRPRRPSEWAIGLPEELDGLALRLLEKEPHKRLGHALSVARTLRSVGVSNGSTPGSRPLPYLYRPDFGGRSRELAWLRDRLPLALSEEEVKFLLVGGESGVGKTRLLAEFACEAVNTCQCRRGALVV